jgi:hypothetical protein
MLRTFPGLHPALERLVEDAGARLPIFHVSPFYLSPPFVGEACAVDRSVLIHAPRNTPVPVDPQNIESAWVRRTLADEYAIKAASLGWRAGCHDTPCNAFERDELSNPAHLRSLLIDERRLVSDRLGSTQRRAKKP